jgi:hypothetical protein
MIITIKIKDIFYIITPSYMFRLPLKKIDFSLKMAPIEGAETCNWEQ